MSAKRDKAVVVHVVDDDDHVRIGITRLLRSAGIEVLAHPDPAAFLEKVANEDGACVLLDLTMEGLSGNQVQQRLNEMGITLPVITVSARDDHETRQRAKALGARMFLRKPVDDQALLDAINWVLNSSHGS